MLALAFACLALAGLVAVLAYLRDRWQHRAHDRERLAWTAERKELVAQVFHAVDKPWSPPPIRTELREQIEPDLDAELANW